MKSAKPPPMDGSSGRRAQPVRQTRTNPPRVSNFRGTVNGREPLASGPAPDHPIEIFPAITHFADAITALPKELVRHFTLLKEVDAKIFVPEEDLFQLVDAAMNAPPAQQQPPNEMFSLGAPASVPMSAQNSSSSAGPSSLTHAGQSTRGSQAPSASDPHHDVRRQFYQQTAYKIQEMLGSLEEKNHVISSANDALQKQLARIDEVWPYVENEFSEEAKWGSTTHWAYPENRVGSKAAQAERTRREGAAAISAAAQVLAEEAAARTDAKKHATHAKRSHKTPHQESDFDDHKADSSKKGSNKVRRAVEAPSSVGLGITTNGTSNGNPPQPKRRKVEKPAPDNAPPERAMASVFGNDASKAKTSSPSATPVPEVPKKRKALPSGSGQSKKRNGAGAQSPSLASSPVIGVLPDPKLPRGSPAPPVKPATASRARQNSLQSAADNSKLRPSSSASNKPNGAVPGTPDLAGPTSAASAEQKANKDPPAPTKPEPAGKEPEPAEAGTAVHSAPNKKEAPKPEDGERKSEPAAPPASAPTVIKSGRASKLSTPALATFQEAAAARSRAARNLENKDANKKKKTATTSSTNTNSNSNQPPAGKTGDEATTGSVQGDDEEAEIDADEPLYCYCNSVSYGEMVACDADDCEREWFHLECVGLKVAPKGNGEFPFFFSFLPWFFVP
ncbi:hypothetical protein SODALDRAFT_16551 [Sodiomyces alkalinus F11]|uniref:Inhibitor of growth protein N-terminal histone-binding domain-containing protein n=1 Tax=Sodiomyces alkalinus (strain CBS 110278 / VKM F-3762 / F11) TaxID=1314773 RepID=A0A3N2Q6Y7_SODAK|nr:hypothetical protein SODALDRAFT_16551 [Sodiomyces alkalinus F11]ROT42476.1 hypothetical protein SODALDRAFT_16551 [Sodiomyces alkalinus F11]